MSRIASTCNWLLALLRSEAGWSRVWVGLGMAIAMAGGGLIYYQAQDSPGTANIWIDTDGGTCTRNSPPAAYSDAAACSSLSAAYAVAACGDTVDIKAGSYGNETITEDADLTDCSQRVVFREATGESVTYGVVTLGTTTTNGPDHLEIHDAAFPNGGILVGGEGSPTQDDVNDIVIDGIDGGNVGVQGGSDIVVRNSDLGPCEADSAGPLECDVGGIVGSQIVIAWSATNITYENNVIHDFICSDPCGGAGFHFECIRMDAGANVTWRANKFWNCQIYAMTSTGYSGTTIIENNWFNSCCGIGQGAGSYAGTENTGGTIILRFNSFGPGQGVWDPGCTGGNCDPIIAIGNVFGGTPSETSGGCYSWVTFQYNVWEAGGTPANCGTGGETYTAADFPYVSDSNSTACTTNEYPCGSGASSMNYHLDESSNADDIVPADLANSCAATDIDGTAINCSTIRDAGSDQR